MTHSARRLVDDLLNVEVDIIVGDDIGPLADVATMSSVIDRYGTWLADHVPAIDARWRSFSPTERDLEAVERARLDAAQFGATGIDEAPGDAAGDGAGAAGVLRGAVSDPRRVGSATGFGLAARASSHPWHRRAVRRTSTERRCHLGRRGADRAQGG
jgi:hypothetical protein